LNPPEPRLERITRATVSVGPPISLGRTPIGERRMVQINTGRFDGRIRGEVLPGGVDYQIITPDGTSYLDARYVISTDDGALILVRNHGIRHGVIGDDPSKYYFRSTPRFECSDDRYAWLNKTIVICSGARTPDSVILDFFSVL
jgi:hypothetical protein